MADQPAELATPPRVRADIAGNSLELIASGQERFQMLLALLAGAKSSVRMGRLPGPDDTPTNGNPVGKTRARGACRHEAHTRAFH